MIDLPTMLRRFEERELDKEQIKELRRAKRFTETVDERNTNHTGDGYGLCSKCKHMHFREFEHGHKIHALCGAYVDGFSTRLSKVHIITECSEFDRKGVLGIENMWAIASMIDLKPKRIVKGFVDTEVSVTPPDEDTSASDLHSLTYTMED